MSRQLYSRRDVRRLLAALVLFIAGPCALLGFLAWQSIRSLHEAAVVQRREALRHDLQDAGRELHAGLEAWLAQLAEPLRGLDPARPAFWDAARRQQDAAPGLRAILVLDAAGRVVFPPSGRTGGDEWPRLSVLHPAAAALAEARQAQWVANDPARAIEFYRAVLNEPRTPEAVRLAAGAEMAWCQQRRGDAGAALETYDRMEAAARTGAPSVWARLRALELAQAAGDEDRARRWRQLLLEGCLHAGLDLDPDVLQAVVARIPRPAGTAAGALPESEEALLRLAAARAAAAEFIRTHGPGPFPFSAGPGSRNFAVAALTPVRAADLLLVDVRAALTNGAWLAFAVDLAAWQQRVAAPRLRALSRRWGGPAEWRSAEPPAGSGPVAAETRLVEFLPVPLQGWALEYREPPASLWKTLAGAPSKGRAAIIGLAVLLALAGLLALFFQMQRSLRLAGLQVDVLDRIAHELRTPITSLSVLGDTLERHADGRDPAADRRIRTLVREEIQRLARFSDRLLDFSGRRSGPVGLRREPGRLDELLADLARRLPDETGVQPERLALTLAPGDYAGTFDRDALEGILRNLVENAVKYSEAPAEVRLALRREDAEAVLTVADRGRGMDARTRRRLFTPYFRGDASLSARVPGLGLGLAIVRGLIRAHGGTIAVQSAPGQGTTFTLRLPLDPRPGGPA